MALYLAQLPISPSYLLIPLALPHSLATGPHQQHEGGNERREGEGRGGREEVLKRSRGGKEKRRDEKTEKIIMIRWLLDGMKVNEGENMNNYKPKEQM